MPSTKQHTTIRPIKLSTGRPNQITAHQIRAQHHHKIRHEIPNHERPSNKMKFIQYYAKSTPGACLPLDGRYRTSRCIDEAYDNKPNPSYDTFQILNGQTKATAKPVTPKLKFNKRQ